MEYPENSVLNTNKVAEPDFQTLLNALRNQIEQNYTLSQEISRFANTLKRIEVLPENGVPTPEKDPYGVIEHFWEEVFKISKSNDELRIVVNHFQNVIGS